MTEPTANQEAVAAGDTAIVDRLCSLLATSRDGLIDRIMADRFKAGRVPDQPDPAFVPDKLLYEGDCPDGLVPYTKNGEIITISADQHDAIWRAFAIWQVVYRHEKGVYPDMSNSANLSKSCLLGRLLFEGKPPLPAPPPLNMSAGWYDLIETGHADLNHRFDVYGPYETPDGFRPEVTADLVVNIGQSIWVVLDQAHGVYEVECLDTRRAPGRWTLRHRTGDDPQVQCGHHRVDPGGPDDRWEPSYFTADDWILDRQ